MDNSLLIGLDLSTTSAKAVAYDLRGKAVARAAVAYPTHYRRPGWAEQSPSEWTSALSRAMQQLIAALGSRKSDLQGVCVSSHGPGLLFVDDKGHSLLDVIPIWQDERCGEQGQRILDAVGGEWIGIGLPLFSFPPRLLWTIENYPDAAQNAKYALTVKDYVIHWLTGEFATEPSSGPGRDYWHAPIFDACGWPLDKLPRILPPIAIVGNIMASRASEFGLDGPLPAVMGTNDGAAETLSTSTPTDSK